MGGGTFDVTIIEINQHVIRVKSTDGDDKLGGKDWDDRLMQHVAEAFKEKHGINVMDDVLARHDRHLCEHEKISLSTPRDDHLFSTPNKPIRLKITREHFDHYSRSVATM